MTRKRTRSSTNKSNVLENESSDEQTESPSRRTSKRTKVAREAQQILDARKKGRTTEYLIKWSDNSKDTWERDVDEELIKQWEQAQEKKRIDEEISQTNWTFDDFIKDDSVEYNREEDGEVFYQIDTSKGLLQTCYNQIALKHHLDRSLLEKLIEMKTPLNPMNGEPEWRAPLSIALKSEDTAFLEFLIFYSAFYPGTYTIDRPKQLFYPFTEIPPGDYFSYPMSLPAFNYIRKVVPSFNTNLKNYIPICLDNGLVSILKIIIEHLFEQLENEKKKGSEVDNSFTKGFSELHFAILNQEPIDKIKELLSKYTPITHEKHEEETKEEEETYEFVNGEWELRRMTPLHLAALISTPEIVSLLIKYGADTLLKDNSHRTPLFYAAISNKPENIKILLQSSKNPFYEITHLTDTDKTPLQRAIHLGRTEATKFMLERMMNQKYYPVESFFSELLSLATEFNYPEIIFYLSKCLPFDDYFFSLLKDLIQFNFPNCIRLLRKGCSDNFEANMRKKGEKLIEGQYYNLIQFCFNQGNLPLVKYFQTLYPINLSADEEDRQPTLFFQVLQQGWVNCVDYLIQSGCNVRDINDNGITALCTALSSGSIECVQLLLREDRTVVNLMNDDVANGFSPIVYYIVNCQPNFKIFSLLVENGADVDYVDSRKNNLFHIVSRLGESEDNLNILDLLLKNANLSLLNASNQSNISPPFLAARCRTLVFLERMLQTKKVDLSQRTPHIPEKLSLHVESKETLLQTVIRFLPNTLELPSSLIQLYLSFPQTSIDETNEHGCTPLQIACFLGNQKLASQLVSLGANLNLQNKLGDTALHVSLSYQPVFEALIPHAPQVLPNEQGKTPLHVSIQTFSSPSQVRLLCKLPSCNVNAVDSEGNTPIFYLSKDSIVICFMLADHGAKFDILNKIGESPLYCALSRRLVNVSFYLMSVIGAKMNQTPPIHKDSLFCQAMNLKTDGLVHYILDKGIKIDGALQDAISTKNFEIAQVLFQRIFIENLRRSVSEPPKLHALFSPHRSNETELIAFLNLLLDNKHLLNIDALDDHGWTCLHHAVLNSYSREILNLLLVKGEADPCIGNFEGETSLHFAIKTNNLNSILTLLEVSNVGKKLVNISTKNGRSPLHYAISTWNSGTFANLEIIELLLKYGADISHTDKNGISCSKLAGTISPGIGEKILALFVPINPNAKAEFDQGREMAQKDLSKYSFDLQKIQDEAKERVKHVKEFRKLLEGLDDSKKEEKKKTKKNPKLIIPVDSSIYGSGYEVYVSEDGTIYDVMLNQTDVSYGTFGHNKFYIIQLLKHSTPPIRHNPKRPPKVTYIVVNRWGRVGEFGQSKPSHFSSLDAAMKDFESKFKEKTKNSWDERNQFKKTSGKYDLIERHYEEEEDEEEKKERLKKQEELNKHQTAPSNLPPEVLQIMQNITDKNVLQNALFNLNYYFDRSTPLGRISMKQINEGFTILSKLEEAIKQLAEISQVVPPRKHINRNVAVIEDLPLSEPSLRRKTRSSVTDRSQTKKPKQEEEEDEKEKEKAKERKSLREEITALTNRFYTVIPHNFGRQAPPIITDLETIKSSTQLLQDMIEVKTAVSLIVDVPLGGIGGISNRFDVSYEALGCEIRPLSKESEEFQIISKYAKTELKNVFKLTRWEEVEKNYTKIASHYGTVNSTKQPNVMLMWHGSGIQNFVGILSQGLRIAPKEAPCSGYNFGKGIYFADCWEKSQAYCRGSNFMLLCEVYLGERYECHYPEYMDAPPKGFHSTKGLGSHIPEEKSMFFTKEGVGIPLGEIIYTGRGSLRYNEYIVYSVEQVKLTYLVHF